MRTAQLIIILGILVALISPGSAATGYIQIWGTNVSTAQSNVTIATAPNNVTITSWVIGNGVKTWRDEVTSASDTMIYSIGNMTYGTVYDLRINGTSVSPLLANSTGWVTFTTTQSQNNHTYSLQPAVNNAGYNFTWSWIQTLFFGDGTSMTTAPTTTLKYTVVNITQNYSVGTSGSNNASHTLYTVHATSGTTNITLPTPATANKGYDYTIKKKDVSGNGVNINVTGNCCIDGAAWANITSKDTSITLVSDGTSEWDIV